MWIVSVSFNGKRACPKGPGTELKARQLYVLTFLSTSSMAHGLFMLAMVTHLTHPKMTSLSFFSDAEVFFYSIRHPSCKYLMTAIWLKVISFRLITVQCVAACLVYRLEERNHLQSFAKVGLSCTYRTEIH